MNKKLKITNNPIIVYKTNIYIHIVDKEGKATDQSFGEKFDSLDMLQNRREAIEYLKTRTQYFFYEESQIYFSSPSEAKLKGYKDFTSLSLSIEIIDDQGRQSDTDFSNETVLDFLDFEYSIMSKYQNIDFIVIEDKWKDTHRAIKEDLEFFKSLTK